MGFEAPGRQIDQDSANQAEQAAYAIEREAPINDARRERALLSQESCRACWPNVPDHAADFLRRACPDHFSLAMDEAAKIDPAELSDPAIAEFLLEDCVIAAGQKADQASLVDKGGEIAARAERVEAGQVEIAMERQQLAEAQAQGEQLDTTIKGLRDKISGNLTGADKLGQLDQLMADVRGADGFPEEERAAALQQLAMIRSTLAAMGQVMSSETSQAAFQQIIASSTLNLGAGGLATTFAPVMAQVEASTDISASEKQRLRAIVTGSDAQNALAETITDENGVTRPRYSKEEPREFRAGVSGYATQGGRQMLALKPGDHPLEMDITGWHGEQVGQLIEVMTIAHDFESVGLTGYLKSTYHIDFALIGDAGLTPDEINRMHNVIDHVLGGMETSDGAIIASGERLGYLRHFARLHNPQGTATGFENDQGQTEYVARDLGYKNQDGSINWGVLRTIGEFARTSYLSGDADYAALKLYVQRQHPKRFAERSDIAAIR